MTVQSATGRTGAAMKRAALRMRSLSRAMASQAAVSCVARIELSCGDPTDQLWPAMACGDLFRTTPEDQLHHPAASKVAR